MTAGQQVVLVAAVADNGVIGLDGDIPWSIPDDLKHFRAVTSGHTVVMGRKTFDSLGRPLPHRTNVVVTRDRGWARDGVVVVHDVVEAIDLAREWPGDVMVMGGAQVYAAALPQATHQVLTEVHLAPAGDTHYPDWDRADWVETERRPGESDGVTYDFVWWERVSGAEA